MTRYSHHDSLDFPSFSSIGSKVLDTFREWVGFGAFNSLFDTNSDFKLYLAGGVVRDAIISSTSKGHDFDLFFDGIDKTILLAHLSKFGRVEFGPFGSPRWHPSGSNGTYADVVPVRGFFNGLWPCVDIVDVLNQFDFTANAIAVDLRTGCISNPQNGIRDASQRTLRFVRFDFPDEPISSVHKISRLSVLWFRALHYSSFLSFELDSLTKRWVEENAFRYSEATMFEELFFKPNLSGKKIDGIHAK